MRIVRAASAALAVAVIFAASQAAANPDRWKRAWPQTDFTMTSIDLGEIMSGGPPKDGIPPIDDPQFVSIAEETELTETEPLISVSINGDARAYPLRILMWHEIVNDEVGGVPITVTFCPLCNAALVFDRRVDGQVLDFGTSGNLRNSDLVMYDRQTESWWQQFLGEAIVGSMLGSVLEMIPARIESFALFRERFPDGQVLVPNNRRMRSYGTNPYEFYDESRRPFLYNGELPEGVPALSRVVTIGSEAWSLELVRTRGPIETDAGLIISWQAGQNSALGDGTISEGKDVGNVVVQENTDEGLRDVPYSVDFAFAFHAFYPDSPIHVE